MKKAEPKTQKKKSDEPDRKQALSKMSFDEFVKRLIRMDSGKRKST